MSDITVTVTTQPTISVDVQAVGATGAPGPTAVSADAGNAAVLGTDNLVYVPESGSGGGAWGEITGTLSDQTDLQAALDGKAAATHSHAEGDITGLVSDLAGKSNVGHTHSADDISDGTTNKAYTATERTKLAGIASGATANSSDATLLARANHTGTQSADTLTDGTTNKAFLATERTKLAGIATGATANSSDATLLARANHTGTQLASTISDFSTAADARITAAALVPQSLVDAKGDLFAGTADNTVARLAVGTNGYVLTADSAQTAGVKWAAASGGVSVADYTKTTASLANAASESGTFTLSASQVHVGLVLAADRACRVRFYATTTMRDNDASRAEGVYPTGNHGLLLEVIFDASNLTFTIAGSPDLFATSGYGAVPVTITNKSGSTSTVAVTLTAKGL